MRDALINLGMAGEQVPIAPPSFDSNSNLTAIGKVATEKEWNSVLLVEIDASRSKHFSVRGKTLRVEIREFVIAWVGDVSPPTPALRGRYDVYTRCNAPLPVSHNTVKETFPLAVL